MFFLIISCYDLKHESEVLNMDKKINVSAYGLLELTNEESEGIADWVSEKELKGDQFIQRIAEIVGEYYANQNKL